MSQKHLSSLVLFACALPVLSACEGTRVGLMKRGLRTTVDDYFAGGVVRFDRVADGVYSYRFGFDRDLVVETTEGLVVVDPFNTDASAQLAAVLRERFPGKPVTHLLYSHYHLDHVRGGAALQPREVIAHERCPGYWADLDARDILPPTRLVKGDVDLEIGGVPIRLLDLGKSHTDTLYAVYLPRQKVLFGADLVFVKAFPPLGHPDVYRPGMLRALERLSALDFNIYVPSHFDTGTKADFLDAAALDFEAHRLVHEVAAMGRQLVEDPKRFDAAFNKVLDTLEPKYGKWHGGVPMLLFFVQRTFVGEFLGF